MDIPAWTEANRLAALRHYDILDTPFEAAFDDLARLAAHVCDAPIALVSLVDEARQWFKAAVGLDVRQTGREESFCAHALLHPGAFVVHDASADPRFACNRLVTGDPHLRFYAGMPLRTPDGLPLGTICVLDREPRPGGLAPAQQAALATLAAQVMAQLELRRAAAGLEAEVQARTLALRAEQAARLALQDRLHRSQTMEAVGYLAGTVAHDFNNLLTGLLGALEMLRRRAGQGRLADVERYAEAMAAGVHRGAGLTQRLLAFSQQQAADWQAVDLNAALAGLEPLLRHAAGEGVALRLDLRDDAGATRCDPAQLEGALLNLVIHARNAMPDGGTLTIRTGLSDAQATPNGDYVGLSVADTGPGLAPDTLAEALLPFFARGHGDAGLGLSLASCFARQSGGHLSAHSAPGAGTLVTLLLPRAAAA